MEENTTILAIIDECKEDLLLDLSNSINSRLKSNSS